MNVSDASSADLLGEPTTGWVTIKFSSVNGGLVGVGNEPSFCSSI